MTFLSHTRFTCQGAMIYPNDDNIETPALKFPGDQRTKTTKEQQWIIQSYHRLKKRILNLDDLLLCVITTDKSRQ